MAIHFDVNIVSAEAEIFSGPVIKLFVSGVMGDLEVLFNHAPLLTFLKPGPVTVVTPNNEEEVFYISGGMLEVQPTVTTVLADTAVRAKDMIEAEAMEAKKRAETLLSGTSKEFNYQEAQVELLEAVGKLKALKKFKEKGSSTRNNY